VQLFQHTVTIERVQRRTCLWGVCRATGTVWVSYYWAGTQMRYIAERLKPSYVHPTHHQHCY